MRTWCLLGGPRSEGAGERREVGAGAIPRRDELVAGVADGDDADADVGDAGVGEACGAASPRSTRCRPPGCRPRCGRRRGRAASGSSATPPPRRGCGWCGRRPCRPRRPSHTQTGMPATMRGAGRPAASAALVRCGTTCDPMARSSAIQRIVPSVRSPASRSICGPSAASSTGVGARSVMSSGLWTRYRSFSTSTGPGPAKARSSTSSWSRKRAQRLLVRAGRASRR